MRQITKEWNWKWMNLTSTERFQLQMPVLHQNYVLLQGCSSQVSGISGQNTKIKYLMYHIPVEILEHYVIPNSSNQNLEICARKV